MTAKSGPSVMIVGGGVGGLCLAQGLKKAGIEVSVYDRDGGANFRHQGYRVSLKQTGTAALKACLPDDIFELATATSLKLAQRMVFLDPQLNMAFPARPLNHPHDKPDPTNFGVNRLTLREILIARLGDAVHFNKTFTKLEHSGNVTAEFADGTTASADILVGADGTNSAVRPFVAPDAKIYVNHYTLYGKTPINDQTLDWLPDVLFNTFNRVSEHRSNVALSVATCRPFETGPKAAAQIAPDVELTEVGEYLSWTLPCPPEYEFSSSEELLAYATETVKDWHPGVQRLIAEAEVKSTFPVVVTSAEPVDRWDIENVTLLGDAIHTMSPGRGDGANTALKDGHILANCLAEAVAAGEGASVGLRRYEEQMFDYGFQAVADSLNEPFLRPIPAGGNGERQPPAARQGQRPEAAKESWAPRSEPPS